MLPISLRIRRTFRIHVAGLLRILTLRITLRLREALPLRIRLPLRVALRRIWALLTRLRILPVRISRRKLGVQVRTNADQCNRISDK